MFFIPSFTIITQFNSLIHYGKYAEKKEKKTISSSDILPLSPHTYVYTYFFFISHLFKLRKEPTLEEVRQTQFSIACVPLFEVTVSCNNLHLTRSRLCYAAADCCCCCLVLIFRERHILISLYLSISTRNANWVIGN